jgi:hypothetical protein
MVNLSLSFRDRRLFPPVVDRVLWSANSCLSLSLPPPGFLLLHTPSLGDVSQIR